MRTAQVLLAIAVAAWAGMRGSMGGMDDLHIAAWAAGPGVLLAVAGLFATTRTRIGEALLLGLTIACALLSLIYVGVSPMDSGSSIVYVILPALQYAGLLTYAALGLLVRFIARRSSASGRLSS